MFWQDKWYSDVPLGMLFPKLFFSRVQVPAGPVLSHWFDTGWNIKVPYLNQGEDVAKREELLQLLHENLSHNKLGLEIDRPSREWDPKRVFSVKSA